MALHTTLVQSAGIMLNATIFGDPHRFLVVPISSKPRVGAIMHDQKITLAKRRKMTKYAGFHISSLSVWRPSL